MKYRLSFLIACFSCFFCSSQEITMNDIKGNWFIYKNLAYEDIQYVETYFGETYFQSVSLDGYSKAYDYIIDSNILYTLPSDKSVREYYAYLILNDSKDILELKGRDDHVILKRIEGIFTFENYSNETISKDNFWDAFLGRKTFWEDVINKSE